MEPLNHAQCVRGFNLNERVRSLVDGVLLSETQHVLAWRGRHKWESLGRRRWQDWATGTPYRPTRHRYPSYKHCLWCEDHCNRGRDGQLPGILDDV